jgi:hypothetical protein
LAVLALAGCGGGAGGGRADAAFDARAAVADMPTHLAHADAWVRVFQAAHGRPPLFTVGAVYDAGKWGFDPGAVRDAAIEALAHAQMFAGADPAKVDAELVLVVVRDAPGGSALALPRVETYIKDGSIYR